MSGRLEQLARRVADDRFFLAAPLAIYASAEGLDDAGLARHLGCKMEDLTMLRLCRAPSDATFRLDVDRIAARFGIDATKLANVLRHAEALEALRQAPTSRRSKGTLMAARDRRAGGSPETKRRGRPKSSRGDPEPEQRPGDEA